MYQSWGTSQYKNHVNDYKRAVEKNDMNSLMLTLDKMMKIELTRKEYQTILESRFEGATAFPRLYGYYMECPELGDLCRRVLIKTTVKLPEIKLGCEVMRVRRTEEEGVYDIPITAKMNEEWKEILLEVPQILSIEEFCVQNKELYVHVLNRMMKLGFKFDENEIRTCALLRSKNSGDSMTTTLYALVNG